MGPLSLSHSKTVSTVLLFAVEDDAVELGLEPLHGVLLGQSVRKSHTASLATPVTNIHAGSAEDNVEVHAVDTNAGVVPREGDIYRNEMIIIEERRERGDCYRIRRPAEF